MPFLRLILSVRSPDELARFYVTALGMTMRTEGDAVVLGYGGDDALLEFRQAASAKAYRHRRSDRYWKIGITLPDVDMAAAQLRAAGIAVSEPGQFGDIGYMCHLNDPEGFALELLQHRFQANQVEGLGDPDQALGGGARIGQITLRTAKLEAALAFYQERLGMRLLSIQPVSAFGFRLHFLAFTDEVPPEADLEAVGNREWLWQRPYTTLELQSFDDPAVTFDLPHDGDPGFLGLAISDANTNDGLYRDEAGGSVFLTP